LSGSIDVPTLVPQPVVGLPFKNRLIDHFGAGRNIDSQAFEFFQQVSRSENAAPVADLGVKPTTTLTMQAVSGYAYFLATVTEPAPVRLLWHFPTVVDSAEIAWAPIRLVCALPERCYCPAPSH
jgi:hypothetical protein